MAGDWIKMRVDLSDDPAVIAIATETGLDEDAVVGKLHRLWSWADRHTTDGKTAGVNAKWVDRYVNQMGFAASMVNAGWLVFGESFVEFPGFQKHNGKSAKLRCENQVRARLSRENRDEGVTGMPRDLIPKPFVKYVFTRDNYRCAYCGTKSDERAEGHTRTRRLSVDHIIPNTRGGKTTIENLVTCCRLCNGEKNDRTPEEWGMELGFLRPGVLYEVDNGIVVTEKCDESARSLLFSLSQPKVSVSKKDIECLYAAYPRKIGKAKAMKEIAKALRDTPLETLMEAVQAFAKSDSGRAGQYCPHPATWFSQRRWEDDREQWNDRKPGAPRIGAGQRYDPNATTEDDCVGRI